MASPADSDNDSPHDRHAESPPEDAKATELTLEQVAARAGVTQATVRRWVKEGLVPQYDGAWTPAAASHVRIVARLRERGHSVQRIREASQSGKLAFGYIDELLPSSEARYTLKQAAREIDLDPVLVERLISAMGQNALSSEEITEEDLQVLRYGAEILAAGLPLPALLQIVRVYGQAMAQVADAEVRLFHLYLHEPLMREGVPGVEVAQAMEGMTREMLPFAVPFINYLHGRMLGYFVEQDVIGHIESDLDDEETAEEGRMRVAIAFADLAGYTKLTEEQGEAKAVSAVERFVETGRADAADRRARDQDAGRRGDGRRRGRGRADGLGGRAGRGVAVWLAAAADRDPQRRGAVSRRRLLRPRGQPRGARRRPGVWRRGARDAPGRGGREQTGWPRVRADRRGGVEGFQRADRVVQRVA